MRRLQYFLRSYNYKRWLRYSILLGITIGVLFSGVTLYPQYQEESVAIPLDPVQFNLPNTAKEVIARRTANTATFELTPGKYAAVSGIGKSTTQPTSYNKANNPLSSLIGQILTSF